ncbi:uncharacterized protein BT62DRAFT_929022 [Guyanagaster necrorhizus]|uniref:Uncharacterized protein n=1 Tax=Guyanagaster necrorhizus TaxID=856835 RepID=A0A9P7VZB4_9AGAR|nr:uncharacterized protein BT62DRAFT_929022 [Guyanagaster necrorhizus MCA 3950]KAG7449024.1 hypothetical protein BT62DRAFT_929022 [Guyanagaster necrorhizus MCA 3950]
MAQNSRWDTILAVADLPPPGPSYYTARRALWLTPRNTSNQTKANKEPLVLAQQKKLTDLVNDPTKAQTESGWNEGIRLVWEGLSNGRKLTVSMPLSLIIKITHAAWIRDNTWPLGAIAPEPDDELPVGLPGDDRR